jgi:Geranylgeranyl pyrophosphate synthase
LQKHFNTLYADNLFCAQYQDYSKKLLDSMHYSLFAGGKRLRPFLVLEFTKLLGGDITEAASYASALEMIHTYSLIHDDLPCMDNDELRRGKPTNHIVFGEATALLAGDSLLTDAFSVLCVNQFSDKQNIAAVKLLSLAAGPLGMAVGQQIDLSCEENQVSEDVLIMLQQKKTGALFTAACTLGCLAAGYFSNSDEFCLASEFAERIGLAFQITDDILDVTGDEKELGKKNGRDEKQSKTTYVSLFTLEGARKKANEQIALAKAALDRFSVEYQKKELLYLLSDYILQRKK